MASTTVALSSPMLTLSVVLALQCILAGSGSGGWAPASTASKNVITAQTRAAAELLLRLAIVDPEHRAPASFDLGGVV